MFYYKVMNNGVLNMLESPIRREIGEQVLCDNKTWATVISQIGGN